MDPSTGRDHGFERTDAIITDSGLQDASRSHPEEVRALLADDRAGYAVTSRCVARSEPPALARSHPARSRPREGAPAAARGPRAARPALVALTGQLLHLPVSGVLDPGTDEDRGPQIEACFASSVHLRAAGASIERASDATGSGAQRGSAVLTLPRESARAVAVERPLPHRIEDMGGDCLSRRIDHHERRAAGRQRRVARGADDSLDATRARRKRVAATRPLKGSRPDAAHERDDGDHGEQLGQGETLISWASSHSKLFNGYSSSNVGLRAAASAVQSA